MLRSLALILATLPPAAAAMADEEPSAAEKGLAYLASEVPPWRGANGCFSCHNNGDGARALYRAARSGHRLEKEVLSGTSAWLRRPGGWEENGGDEEFSDKALATMQFAAALAAAVEAGEVTEREPLADAAAMIAALQQPDGSWRIEGPEAVGGPVTWGRPLATVMASEVLLRADGRRHRERLERAGAWLRSLRIETVLDAAAVLIGLGSAEDEAAIAQRERAMTLLRAAESEDGGWGPYRTSSPEPFDTAVVLIALARLPAGDEARAMIARGRRSLSTTQLADGGWPETTRPAGATSYSHRVSTAGWAVEALVVTGPAEGHPAP